MAGENVLPSASWELHPNHFYDDFDDLVDRLDWIVQNIDTVRQQSLREIAAHYDWGRMAPRYDAQFQTIGK